MRIGKIFKTSYHTENNDELVFDIYGRDIDEKRFHLKVYNTEPYFFVKDKPHPSDLPRYAEMDGTGETLSGDKLWKIKTEQPWQVGKLRKRFEPHYEADIQYNNRMRYDYGWKNYIKFPDRNSIYDPNEIKSIEDIDDTVQYRKCVFDLEDISGCTIKESRQGKGKIGSIAFYDSVADKLSIIVLGKYDSENYKVHIRKQMERADVDFSEFDLDDIKVITVPDEKSVLRKFKNYLRKVQPDILVGWNNFNYDIKVLKNRAKKLNIDFDFSPFAEWDMMIADDRLTYHTVRNKLNIRAKRLLGVGKIENTSVAELYKENKDKFVAYNLWDVIVTQKIDKHHDGTRIHQKLADFAGTNISNCQYQSKIADPYLFHKTKEYTDKGFFDEIPIFPSAKFAEEKTDKFKGGHVEESVTGRFKYVGVLDFKSEYPMWMIELNISPDTYEPNPKPDVDYYVTPAGNYYRKEPKGLIPKILEELLEERDEVKKRMREAKANGEDERYKRLYAEQRGIKILMNSFYGLLGSGGGTFRLSNPIMSADVTELAREHIKFTKEVLKEKGYEVLYADTDSVFFQLQEDTYESRIAKMDELRDMLNSRYDELVERFNKDVGRERIRIDKDKMYEVWFQSGAKKKYIGLFEWEDVDMREKDYDDRLEIKGFESKKADQARLTEEAQKKSFNIILHEKSIDELLDYLKGVYDDVMVGKRDSDLGREAKLSKSPHRYDSEGAHVKAYKRTNKLGLFDIDIGDTFLWYYTPNDKRIAIPWGEDIPEEVNVDRKLLYRKIVFDKVKDLLSPFMKGEVTLDMILQGEKQTGMDKFF